MEIIIIIAVIAGCANCYIRDTSDTIDHFVRDKCPKGKNNGLQKQLVELFNCVGQHYNFTKMRQEFKDGLKDNTLDGVITKYCNSYPQLQQCVIETVEKVKPCLDQKEQDSVPKLLDIGRKAQEFMCMREGYRIAIFVVADGIECVESKSFETQQCFNEVFNNRSIYTLPLLQFTKSDCDDLSKIRFCVFDLMSTCERSFPGNIIDAMFKFLKKQVHCSNNAFLPTPSLVFLVITTVVIILS